MDAKELDTLKEMESGDPNRGLDKAWIHMETEGDSRGDLSVTGKEKLPVFNEESVVVNVNSEAWGIKQDQQEPGQTVKDKQKKYHEISRDELEEPSARACIM